MWVKQLKGAMEILNITRDYMGTEACIRIAKILFRRALVALSNCAQSILYNKNVYIARK